MKIRLALSSLAAAAAATLALGACAPVDDASDAASDAAGSADPSPSEGGSSDDAAGIDQAGECAAADLPTLEPGTLTIGTDSPAYEPWFVDDDPTNGEGFESAVAYEVAERLGFTPDLVSWVTVPFNNSYKPGPKDFDFDINQISITPQRAEVVDFSQGYYEASQAVIALADSPAAEATSLADLQDLRLGAQTGTTSLTAIRDVIQPASDPLVFEDTNAAKQALNNGQLDAILADLPTAFYITAVEIPKASIIGQFQPDVGQQEEFGLLFEKGSPLVECVDAALTEMTDDGTLAQIEQQCLSDTVDVPVLE